MQEEGTLLEFCARVGQSRRISLREVDSSFINRLEGRIWTKNQFLVKE